MAYLLIEKQFKMKIDKDKTGKKFGKITVLFHCEFDNICDCLCKCGNIFRKNAIALNNTGAKSCGCTNGLNKQYPKHMKEHKLYNTWSDIRRKKGKNPGSVKEWEDYRVFYNWAIDKWSPGLRCYSKSFDQPHGPDNTIFVSQAVISKESQNRPEVKIKLTGRHREYNNGENYHNLNKIWRNFRKDGVCKEWENYLNFYNWGISRYFKGCSFVKIDENLDFGPENTRVITCEESRRLGSINRKVSNSSKEEKTVGVFLKSIDVNFIKDRKVLKGRELDFLTDKNIAIEYSGIYWHSELYLSDDYHYEKYLQCKENNIQLINIFSDEWLNRQSQVKNYLRSVFGKNQEINSIICDFKIINENDAFNFINNNDIEELKEKPKQSFGLYYDNKLVSVMTFDYLDNSFVLGRYCCVDGYTVINGAEKLFKNSLKHISKQDIYSWSDNRYPLENMYKVLGFSLIKELKPDYSYILKNKAVNRFNKQFMNSNGNEKEFLNNLNYYRIYDSGKKLWLYKV